MCFEKGFSLVFCFSARRAWESFFFFAHTKKMPPLDHEAKKKKNKKTVVWPLERLIFFPGGQREEKGKH